MTITTYASGSLLNCLFGADPATITPLANYYMGLSTTTISSSGSNSSEPTGAAGYARVTIANTKASNFGYASSGCITNSASLVFGQSSGSWGTIVDVFLADASASATGNIWYFQSLTTPKIVQGDTIVSFSASAITIKLY